MNSKKIIIIILAFISFRCGDDIPDGVVDAQNENLHITSLNVPVDSVYNNPDKPLYISFRVNSPQNLKSAYYNLESPDGYEIFSKETLLDVENPKTADTSTGDGVYSGRIYLDTTHLNGTYRLSIFLENNNEEVLEIAANTFFYFNGKANHRPKVNDDLTAPDTIKLVNGFYKLFMTISAADEDGLSDIEEVYFTSYRPDNSVAGEYELRDDGKIESSGDVKAGDGIYSITMNIGRPDEVPVTRRFEFKAKDRSGAVSEPITHFITITE